MLFKENGKTYVKLKLINVYTIVLSVLLMISGYLFYSLQNNELNHVKFEKLLIDVENNFKGSVDRDILYKHAIKGLIGGLDKYSHAVIKKKNTTFTQNNSIIPSNKYVGTGLVLQKDLKGLMINDIYQDSDLYDVANIGDVITKIDNQEYQNSYGDFIDLLKGKEGEEKNIEITSNEISKNHIIKIKNIRKNNVVGKALNEEIIYIKVKEFSNNLNEEFLDVFDDLYFDMESTKGIIIDLADNPGGLLHEGLLLTGTIIDVEDLALKAEYKDKENSIDYYIEKGDYLENIPVTIIVDKNSASSAEIFAGIFKYFKRGTIVGQQTYGKGVGQSVIEFSDDIEYAMTTFEFFIGKDRIKINGVGVTPDILIKEDYLKNQKKYIQVALDTFNKS
jgi:carboxyl-terminal processing protease